MRTLKTSYTSLPDIRDDFCNGTLEDVQFGPRNQVTLSVTRLIWTANKAQADSQPTYLRFGGIRNFETVKTFFEEQPYQKSEIHRIDYDQNSQSKIGKLVVEISFERTEARIIIECKNLSILFEETD